MGPVARSFVDGLAAAGQSWWQVLPLGPPGSGNCPYQCYSAFAGNPLLISPELLYEDGLISEDELDGARLAPSQRVDFAAVGRAKSRLLHAAFERWQAGAAQPLREAFHAFVIREHEWLDDFALYMALREARPRVRWNRWPRPLLRRNPAALRSAARELSPVVQRRKLEQFLFFHQLAGLRAYAAGKSVRFIGDLPIFVSPQSADVWTHPHLFKLDADYRPRVISGVPPDLFCPTGQRWGNPLYDWKAMRRDGFAWWIARVRSALAQADLIRIDHFRGFAAAWEIPAANSAAANGRWVPAPGAPLFTAIKGSGVVSSPSTSTAAGSLPFFVEDLGFITPDVIALREQFGFPGMRVLQFAFGSTPRDPFLPHNFVPNTVAVTGTHDNQTTAAWFAALSKEDRERVLLYAPDAAADPAWAMIRLAWSSVARLAIVPLQDLHALGSEARMNIPGTPKGNWSWIAPDPPIPQPIIDKLKHQTQAYART